VRIQIDITRPRWLRLPRTWRMRALLTLVAAGIVAVPSAWAVHTFADVPTASPHHADVTAIFNARITTGCAPSLYCPAEAVRRDQMGSFLRRGLGRVARSETGASLALTDTFQTVRSVTLSTGGTTGGTGFVLVNASLGTFDSAAGFGTSPKRLELRVRQVGGYTGLPYPMTVYPTSPAGTGVSGLGSLTTAFPVATGTNVTVVLEARIAFGATPVTAWERALTAVYVPFGSGGGNVLGDEQQPSSPAPPKEG
jgi:hypothetical protein